MKKRVVALYSSSKVENLLNDVAYDTKYRCKLDVDFEYKPIDISELNLLNCLKAGFADLTGNVFEFDTTCLGLVRDCVVTKQKIQDMLIRNELMSFDDVMIECKRVLTKYLHLDISEYDNLLYRRQRFINVPDKSPLAISRLICFVISGRTHHPCVWGLAHNLSQSDFCLYDAIKYIWENCKQSLELFQREECYYPKIENLQRRALLNLDYIFQNDFSSYHRSGWSYVVGGIMNLDAPQLLKRSNILVDTYVDRSFHWGLDIMVNMGILPYKAPWYGFIHHTFDTTHSDYNCVELIKNEMFQESLKCCLGLIVLSKSLGLQLRQSLDVPIHILYHPMEFVENTFTIEKFLNNPKKRIVQIGAWLRNPYSIYELPLPSSSALQKTALKGKEMEQYFAPPTFLEVMDDVLVKKKWFEDAESEGWDNEATICRQICRHPQGISKFCQGYYDMTVRHLESVEVLQKLNNEDYDRLLSENIVFLNLVDCSAVNTVVECIVRNTVLIVNRLPALEEILGKGYPGFYDSLFQAAQLCSDISTITRIHEYMKRLDKQRYKLENFIQNLQEIIADSKNDLSYELFMTPENVFMPPIIRKFTQIHRFLPRRYLKI